MRLPMSLGFVFLRYDRQHHKMKRKQLRVCIWTLAALIAIVGPCWLICFTTVPRPVALELKEHAPHIVWFRPLPGPATTNRGALKSVASASFSFHVGRFPIDGWSKDQVAACFGTPTINANLSGSIADFFLAPRYDLCWAYGDADGENMAMIWFHNGKTIYATDPSTGF